MSLSTRKDFCFFASNHFCTLPYREKKAFYRKNKQQIFKRKDCCYEYPVLRGSDTIDPKAALWLAHHDINEFGSEDFCKKCLILPALQKLYNLCSHTSLLQVESSPEKATSENERKTLNSNLAFAQVAIPPEVVKSLPGESYIRKSSIFVDHNLLSGKMRVLDHCLRRYSKDQDRVLLFSFSTVTLDFIEEFVKGEGYTHIRLDGSTPTRDRQKLIDEFQKDKTIFLFLISTKAGGLGLNLTAANRVIIYDVNCT